MEVEPEQVERMYRLLEVPPGASAQQIRSAYRRLAHHLHPDTHPSDPDAPRRFREITEAYELLSRPEDRARGDDQHWTFSTGAVQPSKIPTATVAKQSPPPAGFIPAGRPIWLGPGPVQVTPTSLIAGPVHVGVPAMTGGASDPASLGLDLFLIRAISIAWWTW